MLRRRYWAVVVIVLILVVTGLFFRRKIFWQFQYWQRAVPYSNWFDFPIGYPNAKGCYNAQAFGENNHLGEDWNGIGGGDTDLGDPVYSIGDGIVVYAQHAGPGWGNIVRIVHGVEEGNERYTVEALYAHLQNMLVKEKERVKRGQSIGTVGNADGRYPAHLHLELRSKIGLPLGSGYGRDTSGFLNPTEFIKSHRVKP